MIVCKEQGFYCGLHSFATNPSHLFTSRMPFRIKIQCNNTTQIFCPCFPSSKDQHTRAWNFSSLIRSAGSQSTPLTHCVESVWHFDKNFEFTCITMFLAGCYDGLYYSLGHYVCPPGSFTVIWAQPGSHRRAINEQRNVIVCVWPYTNFLFMNKTWGNTCHLCMKYTWAYPVFMHFHSHLCLSQALSLFLPWQVKSFNISPFISNSTSFTLPVKRPSFALCSPPEINSLPLAWPIPL